MIKYQAVLKDGSVTPSADIDCLSGFREHCNAVGSYGPNRGNHFKEPFIEFKNVSHMLIGASETPAASRSQILAYAKALKYDSSIYSKIYTSGINIKDGKAPYLALSTDLPYALVMAYLSPFRFVWELHGFYEAFSYIMGLEDPLIDVDSAVILASVFDKPDQYSTSYRMNNHSCYSMSHHIDGYKKTITSLLNGAHEDPSSIKSIHGQFSTAIAMAQGKQPTDTFSSIVRGMKPVAAFNYIKEAINA